jgi:hypothetical protein
VSDSDKLSFEMGGQPLILTVVRLRIYLKENQNGNGKQVDS